jgi:hypothetical protein
VEQERDPVEIQLREIAEQEAARKAKQQADKAVAKSQRLVGTGALYLLVEHTINVFGASRLQPLLDERLGLLTG